MAALGRISEDFPSLAQLAGEPEPEIDEDDQAEAQLQITRQWNSVLRGNALAKAEASAGQEG